MSIQYDNILTNLFVGSYPATGNDIHRLKDAGVAHVLNLQSDDDFDYLGVDWAALRAHYFAAGLKVQRVPIQDFDDDDLLDKLPAAVDTLTELVQPGRPVYVHCTAGVNRSPSVVIAYLHWVEGWSLEQAARHVRQEHPCSPVIEVLRRATSDRQHG